MADSVPVRLVEPATLERDIVGDCVRMYATLCVPDMDVLAIDDADPLWLEESDCDMVLDADGNLLDDIGGVREAERVLDWEADCVTLWGCVAEGDPIWLGEQVPLRLVACDADWDALGVETRLHEDVELAVGIGKDVAARDTDCETELVERPLGLCVDDSVGSCVRVAELLPDACCVGVEVNVPELVGVALCVKLSVAHCDCVVVCVSPPDKVWDGERLEVIDSDGVTVPDEVGGPVLPCVSLDVNDWEAVEVTDVVAACVPVRVGVGETTWLEVKVPL